MQDERVRANLPHAVVRLFRLVNRVHNRALGAHGVTAEQVHVLVLLWTLGPMTIGKLQKLLALSSPTLTGAIDRMVAQKLLRRRPDPDDRRAVVLEAEPGTARKRAAIEKTLAESEEVCFGTLTASERRELLRLLDKAASALEEAQG